MALLVAVVGCVPNDAPEQASAPPTDQENAPLNLTEEQWRQRLTPEQFRVLRQGGTEPQFASAYCALKKPGTYLCAGCGEPLFASGTKFESGSGWPSFFEPIDDSKIEHREDRSHGMVRTEVVCATWGGYLGHVFDDGPPPTGLRYCINGVALKHIPPDADAEE